MPPSPLPPTGPALDRVVRRNTLTLASALAISWTVIQLQAVLAPITTEILTGQTWSAGAASALFSVTLGLVAIPAGRLMDRFGRGPVIVVGFVFVVLIVRSLVEAIAFEIALETRVRATQEWARRDGRGYVEYLAQMRARRQAAIAAKDGGHLIQPDDDGRRQPRRTTRRRPDGTRG